MTLSPLSSETEEAFQPLNSPKKPAPGRSGCRKLLTVVQLCLCLALLSRLVYLGVNFSLFRLFSAKKSSGNGKEFGESNGDEELGSAFLTTLRKDSGASGNICEFARVGQGSNGGLGSDEGLDFRSLGSSSSMISADFSEGTSRRVTGQQNANGLEEVSSRLEQVVLDDMYTIVVSTFNRDNELIKNLDHWLSCPHVYQVQVVWHDPNRDPPTLLAQMENEYKCNPESNPSKKDNVDDEDEYTDFDDAKSNGLFKKLWIRRQKRDLLSNRFREPPGGFRTRAVFNIDDDAVIDCRLMTAGFEQWKRLGHNSMVGYEPRQINWQNDGNDQGYTWYASCEENSCEYNTLWPTKGAFLHRSFYKHYWHDDYQPARKLVDKFFTGEDILMTFVHFARHVKHQMGTYNPKTDSSPENYSAKSGNKNRNMEEVSLPLMESSPPILSIQAGSGFIKSFYDKTNRFTFTQKLLKFPDVVLFRSGVAELNSLGLRSSWHRNKVTEAVGKLSELLPVPGKFQLPSMTREWFFVFENGTEIATDSVCGTNLFESLQCTTKQSLTPLNERDVEIMGMLCVTTLIGIVCAVKSYCSYKHKKDVYETVKMRKVSCSFSTELGDNRDSALVDNGHVKSKIASENEIFLKSSIKGAIDYV